MKRGGFTETRIVSILKMADAGNKGNEFFRRHGIESLDPEAVEVLPTRIEGTTTDEGFRHTTCWACSADVRIAICTWQISIVTRSVVSQVHVAPTTVTAWEPMCTVAFSGNWNAVLKGVANK